AQRGNRLIDGGRAPSNDPRRYGFCFLLGVVLGVPVVPGVVEVLGAVEVLGLLPGVVAEPAHLVLPDERELPGVLAPSVIVRFNIVCVYARPVASKPSGLWFAFKAAGVCGPCRPSIGPGSKPLSFRACWTSRTRLWSARPSILSILSARLPCILSFILSLRSRALSATAWPFSFVFSLTSCAVSFVL